MLAKKITFSIILILLSTFLISCNGATIAADNYTNLKIKEEEEITLKLVD